MRKLHPKTLENICLAGLLMNLMLVLREEEYVGLPICLILSNKRWKYDLKSYLPSLSLDVGPWKQVRHDYYQTLLDLFIERWAKPYYEYCSERGLALTGHYWEHAWPEITYGPDNMAM